MGRAHGNQWRNTQVSSVLFRGEIQDTKYYKHKAHVPIYSILQNDSGADLYHDSTALEAVLTELRPHTDYVISVVPFNRNGMGDSSAEIRVKTFSSTPSEPPNNVTLEVTSSSVSR